MNGKTVKKILVIRFSSLGDVLLTAPLLKSIKQNYPGSEVHYLTKTSFAPLISGNPNVDFVIKTEDKLTFRTLKALKKKVKADGYDLIIDAHNNLRTFYLKAFLKAKKQVFKKHSVKKFLLVSFKINLMKNLPPVSERYCRIIPGNKYIHSRPELYIDQASIEAADRLLAGLNLPDGKKLICISPVSNHFTKTYPPEYYAEVINMLDNGQYIFLLAGRGRDKANINIIKSLTGQNVIDLCDKLSLGELGAVIKKSVLLISGDTGPMHIAEALGIPLVMTAGSSVREFGFYPQTGSAAVLENNTLKCRPCSHIGRSECPLGHFKCMREITAANVRKKILELFQQNHLA